MIERQFVNQKLKEFRIREYMAKNLAKAGYSHTDISRTPLGEKIVVYTTRPGSVVGRKGDNIKKLTAYLKRKFKMENPQIEIGEVDNPMMDVQFVADKIAYNFERFDSKRFKSIGYKVLQEIMDAGALGAEIILSGKLPSSRARSWRFSAGYLKKSGDIAVSKVKKAIIGVQLRAGTVGIKVSIMTPDIKLPDKLMLVSPQQQKASEIAVEQMKDAAVHDKLMEEIKTENKEEKVTEKKETKRKPRAKKTETKETTKVAS